MIVAEKQAYQHLPGERRRLAVRPRPRARRSLERLSLTAAILFCVGLAILASLLYARILITAYHISRVQKEVAALELQTRSLAEDVSRLSSLERVEALAVRRLGMTKPDERRLVLVQAENSGNTPPAGKDGPGTGQAGEAPPGQQHWLLQALVELINRRPAGGSG
ncbi:septum formation initiator family protein [Desulfovirgula thermocuniculi]|uniref:septum formation initiator family protein n=1 Tax=Desulfovirgula thermocuniculi TaxID=348842 RepID=UPI0003FD4FF6|nr:septum formation initiator family protein [Desulfovirgula thermocuniculi]